MRTIPLWKASLLAPLLAMQAFPSGAAEKQYGPGVSDRELADAQL